MEELRRIDFTVPPSGRLGGIAHQGEIKAQLVAELVDLFPLVDDLRSAIIIASRDFFTNVRDEAAVVIGNHAFNDIECFLVSILTGEGRDSARVSRALFEHLLNYCEVKASQDANERYVQHKHVTANLLSNVRRNTQMLTGKEQKIERARLKKLGRDSANALHRALAKYGAKFRRGWSARDLRSRADSYGYKEGYDVYRILSQVMHGSYGGTIGTHGSARGKTVHRIGPSLDLAIFCYPEGLRYFRDLVREIELRDNVPMREVVGSLDALIHYWPNYRRILLDLDRKLWPLEPPPPPVAILAIHPSGTSKWYYWEPGLNLMKLAIRPENSEALIRDLKRKFTEEGIDQSGGPDGRPFTVAVANTPIRPKPGATWFNSEAILVDRKLENIPWLGR